MPNTQPFSLLTKHDLAKLLQVCTKTVDNHVRAGRVPRPIAIGNKCYWHPDTLARYLDETFMLSPPAVPQSFSIESEVLTSTPALAAAMVRSKSPAPKGKQPPFVRAKQRQEALLKRLNHDNDEHAA